jgi:hypothetical protein
MEDALEPTERYGDLVSPPLLASVHGELMFVLLEASFAGYID